MAAKQQEVKREYHFPDGTLEQLSDTTAENVTRDLTDFAARGVDAGTVDDLNDLKDDFAALPTDEESRAVVTEAVEVKDAAIGSALDLARTLRTAAQNVWGENKGKYKRFGFKGMDNLADNNVPRALRRMHRVGTTLQSALAGEGIDTTWLDGFKTAINTADDEIDNVMIAEEQRDADTHARIEAGNALYHEIVRLCNIGKDIYRTTNESKYNDYVIENFTGTGETIADGYDILTYTVPSGGSILFPEPPGGGIPSGLDVYFRAVNGSVKVCTTNLPADPCTTGYNLLMAKTYAGLFSELGLDMTKGHIQFTNPGLTDVKIRAGLKKE